jgi:hypothetical protein
MKLKGSKMLTNEKLAKIIFSQITEGLLEDEEIAKEYLHLQGIDSTQATNEFLQNLEIIKGKAKLEIGNQRRLKIQGLKKIIKDKSEGFAERRKQMLAEMFGNRLEPSFSFRNLEKITEKDLEEMQNEADLLKLIIKLSEKEK